MGGIKRDLIDNYVSSLTWWTRLPVSREHSCKPPFSHKARHGKYIVANDKFVVRDNVGQGEDLHVNVAGVGGGMRRDLGQEGLVLRGLQRVRVSFGGSEVRESSCKVRDIEGPPGSVEARGVSFPVSSESADFVENFPAGFTSVFVSIDLSSESGMPRSVQVGTGYHYCWLIY